MCWKVTWLVNGGAEAWTQTNRLQNQSSSNTLCHVGPEVKPEQKGSFSSPLPLRRTHCHLITTTLYLSLVTDRTAVQNTSLQLTAPVPADSFCPKCKSSQWTQNSSLHVPIWGRWMGLPASSWGLPGHSRSFQDSFLLKLCLQATITIQCPLHPREEGVLPSCSSLPIQLPPCSLFCRPAQTALSLLSYHFLSYIRIIQPHTLFLLLSGKQGRNIFFSSLSSPQHLHFVTWVLSLLSHTQ